MAVTTTPVSMPYARKHVRVNATLTAMLIRNTTDTTVGNSRGVAIEASRSGKIPCAANANTKMDVAAGRCSSCGLKTTYAFKPCGV